MTPKPIAELVSRTRERVMRRLRPPSLARQHAQYFADAFGRFTWEQLNDHLRAYWRQYRRLDALLARAGLQTAGNTAKLLDVGGGYTSVLRLFDGPYRWVLDIALSALEETTLPIDRRLHWITGPGEQIPFPDGFFDAVFCSNALDHVENPARVVAEMHRVLKPGGHLVLVVDVFLETHRIGAGLRDALHPFNFGALDVERLVEGRFAVELHEKQPNAGKVGLMAVVKGGPPKAHTDREEHLYVLRRL